MSYACPIIMNFWEDRGVYTFYLPTKFQFHRLINNGDLLADRNRWKDRQTDTHTHRLNLILSLYSTKGQVIIITIIVKCICRCKYIHNSYRVSKFRLQQPTVYLYQLFIHVHVLIFINRLFFRVCLHYLSTQLA